MNCIDRYDKYKDESFDIIMKHIRNGTIKTGKYSHLVKVDKSAKIGKELFSDDDRKE